MKVTRNINKVHAVVHSSIILSQPIIKKHLQSKIFPH